MSAVLGTRPALNTSLVEWLPVLVGLGALYIPVFIDLASSIWLEAEYAHGPLILAVVIWLVLDKRQVFLAPRVRAAHIPAFSVLTTGLLLYVIGRSQSISVIEVGALLPILAGVALGMRGWRGLRTCWFALFFIVFLVPLPGTFVDALTGPLKQYVSALAGQLLYYSGYPIARSGVVITIGQYQLLVADACSGLNSMLSLTAVGLLYLYLVNRKSPLHSGLVIASLLPIAFMANIVRVVFLVLVTYHFGDAAGQGFLHGFSGIVLFLVALLLVVLVDVALVRLLKTLKSHPV